MGISSQESVKSQSTTGFSKYGVSKNVYEKVIKAKDSNTNATFNDVVLPANPSEDDLKTIEQYVKLQRKILNKNVDTYQDKIPLTKKLFLFKHKQQESDNWYYRMYCGNRKYKVESLKTSNVDVARELALEKWQKLQSHIDKGGDVFQKTNEEYLQDYVKYLEHKLKVGDGIKKITLTAKRTSLKKLKTKLKPFNKPSDINPKFLRDYVEWRRTAIIEGGNWDKHHHKNNFEPPTSHTIYKEVCDFRGFFDWLREENIYLKDIVYPKINLDFSKMKEKNPSYSDDDWIKIVYFTRTWRTNLYTIAGVELRRELEKQGEPEEVICKKIGLFKKSKYGKFYRNVWIELFKILGGSGMRLSESLKLQWQDIDYQTRKVKSKSDKESVEEIAIITIPPDTKSGRRKVPTGAGVYFRRVRELYIKQTGKTPKPTDYIFRNIGTDNSKEDKYVGMPLSNTYCRKLFYEMMEEMRYYKPDIIFTKKYTIHSCRAFFINTRLEMGVPPSVLGVAVGHNLKTMMKHYENINVMNLKEDFVRKRRKKLEEWDFKTTDIDNYNLVKATL